jgi:hypothetical protein
VTPKTSRRVRKKIKENIRESSDKIRESIILRSGRKLIIPKKNLLKEIKKRNDRKMVDFNEDRFISFIPMFNGEQGKLESFIGKCEAYHDTLQQDHRQTFVNSLIFRVEDRAYEIYRGCKPQTWKDFKEALQKEISVKKSVIELESKLKNIRQNSLDITEFSQKLSQLSIEIKRSINGGLEEESVKKYRIAELEKQTTRIFREGLNEPLKSRIYAATLRTNFQETVDLALEEEPYAKQTGYRRENFNRGNGTNQFSNTNRNGSKEESQNKQENQDGKRDNFSRENNNRNFNGNRYRNYSGRNYNDRGNYYNNRNRMGNGVKGPESSRVFPDDFICYKCGEKGHIARNCTKWEEEDKKSHIKEEKVKVANTSQEITPKNEQMTRVGWENENPTLVNIRKQ